MPRLDCITILEAGSFGSDSGTVVIPTGEVPFPNHANVYAAVGTAAGIGTAVGISPGHAGAAAGVGSAAGVGADAAASVAFRYWRVYTNYTGMAAAIVAEFELRETPSGADATGSGTATASGSSGGNVPANAVDNNASTWWTSNTDMINTANPAVWTYDFGSGVTKDIQEVTIKVANDSSGDAYGPRAFHIQRSSDNSAWTTVWGVRTMSAWANAETRTFTRPSGYATTPQYGNAGSIGARTGTITVTSDASMGGGSMANLVDGVNTDLVNWWNTGTYVKFDFGVGASKVIDGFTWYQNAATSHGTWVMEGSNDDSSYTTFVETFSLGAAKEHVVTLTNTTGYRYYRLRKTAGSVSNGPYLREIEFKIK